MSELTAASSVFVKVGDDNKDIFVHHWNEPLLATASVVVVVNHGFLAHGNYPTVRYAAELLAKAGYCVVAADLPGHGKSAGLRGYLPSPDELIQLGVDLADYASGLLTSCDKDANKKVFLLGSSLGGAMALAVAHQLKRRNEQSPVCGVMLLAPMLRLNVDTPTRYILSFLATLAPTWQAIPSASTSMETQYRDPRKRQECLDDALSISGSTIRIGSARTCVEMTHKVNEYIPDIDFPFLLLVASEDVVVDNRGAFDLYANCKSVDKTLKEYPALHGLLCEPSPVSETIERDLLEWLQQRV
jgi:acylglycerol lipase